MRLRPATADDADRLADIVMAATKAQGRWPDNTPEQDEQWRAGFAEWSRNPEPDSFLSVILLDDEVVGRLRVVRRESALHLAGIQLLPSVQGRGIGTAIIRDLQGAAARDGVPLLIGVEKDNPRARRLYERLGCVVESESDDEYLLRWTPKG
ncbi:GNAT family N-acetyltransferase [Actinoplanes sp. Pm04-4]|uniref:GNAT family N-acetyltransferase n=1 Tax=Paractinoplanes pyxinae TaxID=2997416 RepID=A0ABT4B292_9ACTN|nr:GNAT family N-acetyltransferase [Actinoplanes pyxinae]MCY1139738.1 GNAT family N-acetyltransferase [Actinoplanes pyxinae]